MTTEAEVLFGAAIFVGLVGVVLLVLPGSLIVAAAIALWAYETGDSAAWLICGIAVALIAFGAIAKWFVAERHLRGAGVKRSTMVVAGLAGIVGFFVIPVLGLVIGFVAGIYATERRRRPHAEAWHSTLAALRASGLALLVELAGVLLAAATWLVGAITV